MEPADAVWTGVYLRDRKDELHNIHQYQIDGFYVEVFYNRQPNEIVHFRFFSNPDQLFAYEGKINIDALLKP